MDDFLEKYIKAGASKGHKICKKQNSMSAEEIWIREPSLQCEEELIFYKEIFEFILEDLRKIKEIGRASCRERVYEAV